MSSKTVTKKIRILQEDIDNGCQKDSTCCMIALAVRRELQIPKAFCVEVDSPYASKAWHITISKGWDDVEIPLAKYAGEKAEAFDDDKKKVGPFKTEIEIPERVFALIEESRTQKGCPA